MEAELRKLEYNLGGVADMQRVPDAVIIIDLKTEEIALREAERLEIPIIGLVDSNCDPSPVRYVVPGNDDAIRSCDLIVGALGSSIEGAAAQWRAAEEKRRAEEEERKRKEDEERKRREAEERAKQGGRGEGEGRGGGEGQGRSRGPRRRRTPSKAEAEAKKEAAEEIPQPQAEDAPPAHDRQGDAAEANKEAAIEIPQPPPADDDEQAQEPAPTQTGGES